MQPRTEKKTTTNTSNLRRDENTKRFIFRGIIWTGQLFVSIFRLGFSSGSRFILLLFGWCEWVVYLLEWREIRFNPSNAAEWMKPNRRQKTHTGNVLFFRLGVFVVDDESDSPTIHIGVSHVYCAVCQNTWNFWQRLTHGTIVVCAWKFGKIESPETRHCNCSHSNKLPSSQAHTNWNNYDGNVSPVVLMLWILPFSTTHGRASWTQLKSNDTHSLLLR